MGSHEAGPLRKISNRFSARPFAGFLSVNDSTGAGDHGGSFQPYQSDVQETSLVFVGENNQTWHFYIRTADFVSNQKPAKTCGDPPRALSVELAELMAALEPGRVVLN